MTSFSTATRIDFALSFALLFKRIKFINPIEVNVIDNTPNNYIAKQQTKGFKLFFSKHYTFKAFIKNFLVG